MALVRFPYPDIDPLSVPDANLVGVFERARTTVADDPRAVVRSSLDRPYGLRLDQLARPGMRVVILVDDITRPTRLDVIIPLVLESLNACGVAHSDISFLVALGTHRPMTVSELGRLGPSITDRYEVRNHQWQNQAVLETIGTTQSGIEVTVNRALLEADLVVGLGHIAPHSTCGFGGGGKIVLPGVAGPETTYGMHAMARSLGLEKLRGTIDNPVRREINTIALMAGLKFIVNVVQDGSNQILGCFSGHPTDAHGAGCSMSLSVHGTAVPGSSDIVIVDSYPADIDLWQAAKALGAAHLVVRQGGVVILVSPCPEGVSSEHTVLLDLAHLDDKSVLSMIDSGQVSDKVGASAVIGFRRYTSRATVIVVSAGIRPEDKRRLGLVHARDATQALDMAFDVCGRAASVTALRHGGEVFPIMP